MAEQQIENKKQGIYAWAGRHPKATFFFVILIIVVVFVFLFDRSAKNQLNRQIADARARGEPMSADDLNAALSGTPAEQNPAVILLNETACFRRAEKLPEDVQKHLPIIGRPAILATGVPLSDEQRRAIHAYLASNESEFYPSPEQVDRDVSALGENDDIAANRTLKELRKDMLTLLAMPGGCLEFPAVSPMIDMQTPELTQIRAICKFFSVSCLKHIDEGEMAESLRDIRAHLVLARYLDSHYPSVIQTLVRLAIEALAMDMIERAVNRTLLDADAIALIESELKEIETTPDLQRAFMWERVMFLDTFEWVKANGGIGIQAPGTSNLLKILPVLPSQDVSSGVRFLTRYIAAAENPTPGSFKVMNEVETEREDLPKYYLFTRILLPSLSRSLALWLRGIGSKRAMIAALACERYRMANSEWPESLIDLVPDYLTAVPVDPFDGAPIRYAVTSEGIAIWCIGEDLKDDGGEIKRRARKNLGDRPTDWGWLILNPDLRGKPLPAPAAANTTNSPATQAADN